MSLTGIEEHDSVRHLVQHADQLFCRHCRSAEDKVVEYAKAGNHVEVLVEICEILDDVGTYQGVFCIAVSDFAYLYGKWISLNAVRGESKLGHFRNEPAVACANVEIITLGYPRRRKKPLHHT